MKAPRCLNVRLIAKLTDFEYHTKATLTTTSVELGALAVKDAFREMHLCIITLFCTLKKQILWSKPDEVNTPPCAV